MIESRGGGNRENEPTGEPETLTGKNLKAFGGLAEREVPKTKEKKRKGREDLVLEPGKSTKIVRKGIINETIELGGRRDRCA